MKGFDYTLYIIHYIIHYTYTLINVELQLQIIRGNQSSSIVTRGAVRQT